MTIIELVPKSIKYLNIFTANILQMKRIFFVLAICTLNAYPQFHAPINQDYLTTKNYVVFPGVSGLAVGGQAHVSFRNPLFTDKQLVNENYLTLPSASNIKRNFELPTIYEWSAHHRVWDRTGVSFSVYNDTRNYPSISKVSTGLARSIYFGNNIRSIRRLAIGARMNYVGLKYGIFGDDNLTLGVLENLLTYDIGLSFVTSKYFVHSVLNNISSKRASFSDFDSASSQFALHVGFIQSANSIKIEPSVMFQTGFIPENSPFKPKFLPYTLDFNFKTYTYVKTNILWGAISYRTAPGFDNNDVRNDPELATNPNRDASSIYEGNFSSLSFLLGFQNQKVMFAYTMSVQSAFDSFYKNQFNQSEMLIPGVTYHQFTLGLKLSGNGMRYYENSINSASPFY